MIVDHNSAFFALLCYSHYLRELINRVDRCNNERYINTFVTILGNSEVVTKPKAKLFEHLLKRYFIICATTNDHPWRTIEDRSLQFVLKLRVDYLKDMQLYLLLHMYIACKVKMCDNDDQRSHFLDDFLNWLPNVKLEEQNELELLIIWSQVICYSTNLYLRGCGTPLLEKAQK